MKLLKTLIMGLVVSALLVGVALPTLAASNNATTQTPAYQLAKEQGAKGKPNKEKGDRDKDDRGKEAREKGDRAKEAKENGDKAARTVIRGLVQGKSEGALKIDGKEVLVTRETRYHVPGQKNATLADIKVGMYVVAQTTTRDGKHYARQIAVVPGRSLQRYTGKVTAFSYTPPVSGNVTATSDNTTVAGSISILDKDGKTLTFDIIAGQFKIQPKGDVVQIGDQVTVIARHIPTTGKLVAIGVIVHHPVKQVSGNITAIDETAKTITVGTTTLKYNEKTRFELIGILAVKVGQQATAWYREQVDNTLLALRLRVK